VDVGRRGRIGCWGTITKRLIRRPEMNKLSKCISQNACRLILLIFALLLLPTVSHARMYQANTGRFVTMDTYEGNQQDPLSLHKFLYAADNPINSTDPSGRKTVVTVTDQNHSGAGDVNAAAKAASHFQKAGWTIIVQQSGTFGTLTNNFDALIFSGHGDETSAADLDASDVEAQLKRQGIKLDAIIALSCHGFDFSSRISQHGYTSPIALVMGYWGYSINSPGRNARVGHAIDSWLANPKFTSVSFGNLLTDGFGTVGVPVAAKAKDIWDNAYFVEPSVVW
jgi:hypothetical protein